MPQNTVTDPITDRKFAIGREQILTRLWELATLSHEATRGSIAGQMKAISMIVAIEGLIPDRRLSSPQTKPASPPVNADIYKAEWLRKQQQPGEEPGDPVAATEAQPAAPQVPEPVPAPTPAEDTSSPNRNESGIAHPFINPAIQNWVPDATGSALDAVLNQRSSLRRPFSRDRRFSGPRR